MNDQEDNNQNNRKPKKTVTFSVQVTYSDKAPPEHKSLQPIKTQIDQKKVDPPKKAGMVVIQILLIIYILSGSRIIVSSRSQSLIPGGITYLVSVFGLIPFSYLGMRYPWKFAECMSIAYIFYSAAQLIMTVLNLIYLIASTHRTVVVLLVYMFVGFIIIAVAAKIAVKYSNDTKAYLEQFSTVYLETN